MHTYVSRADIFKMAKWLIWVSSNEGYIAALDSLERFADSVPRDIYNFFQLGLEAICDGRTPDMLELQLKIEREILLNGKKMCSQDIVDLMVAEKLIPLIQANDEEMLTSMELIYLTDTQRAEYREWIVKNVRGMGWKEASHFLRNVGFGEELAILDRHILRNMERLGVIENIPKTITGKNYVEMEAMLREYVKTIDIPMDEMDLLLWYKEAGEIFK